MENLAHKTDGSGREPRPKQLEVLNWLDENWHAAKFKIFRGATGIGKSYIARAIQLSHPGAVIMTSSNHLIQQNLETYPNANFVIGAKYYDSHDDYQTARKRLNRQESSFVNPISYDRFKFKNRGYIPPRVLIVDEFHVVARMLNMLLSINLPVERYGQAPSPENDFAISEWFTKTLNQFQRLVTLSQDRTQREEYSAQLDKLKSAFTRWRNYPSKYLAQNSSTGLVIQPIDVPSFIIKNLFAADHVVLMSATPDYNAIELLTQGDSKIYKDFGSIIPPKNNTILFRPIGDTLNRDTDPEKVANWIKQQVYQYPQANAIIHVPYSWQPRLIPYLPGFLSNTPTTKSNVLRRFRESGGRWLASGCSEGIDLPYDQCRLNIIPMLWRPNLGSKLVQKKIARHGNKLVDREVVTVLQQQCGRSTRHADDSSTIIVGDPGLPRLINKLKNEIPSDFLTNIKWSI